MLFLKARSKRKRVWIHAGLGKTGTSAVQGFLSQNASQLERQGITYPSPEAMVTVNSGKCSGNLIHVMAKHASKDGIPSRNPDLVKRYLPRVIEDGIRAARTDTVLFSGECIGSHLTPALVDFFKDLSSRHDVTLVGFVRDPYDLAISTWKQAVKMGHGGDLLPRLEKMKGSGGFNLSRLAMMLRGGLDLRLRNYDVDRRDVIGALAKVIGLDLQARGLTSPDVGQKNPSLSFRQAKAVQEAQRSGLPDLAALLVERFLNQPDTQRDPYLPEIDALILEALKDDLALLNQHLSPDAQLRTAPRAEVGTQDEPLPQDLVETINRAKVELNAKSNRPPPRMTESGLPEDFDPAIYLKWHPDVAAAGIDPATHYLNYGRFEGRRVR